jgi:hypothetical protein
MSARVLILTNPLDASRRRLELLEAGTELLAWVRVHAKPPGRAQRAVFVGDARCEDERYRVADGDEILVAFVPTYAEIGTYIIQALVALAVSYVVNRLFAPSAPKAQSTPNPSQVYGIAPPKNAARLGQPIPVIYGSVVALPDFAAQPYTFFSNNEQYLHALLCVTLGEADVAEMLFAQTSGAPLPADVVKYWVFTPGDHQSTFGVIQGQTGVRENVVTSPAVGTQELVAPNAGGTLTPSTWYWKASNFAQTTTAPPTPPYIYVMNAHTPADKLAMLPAAPTLGTTAQAVTGFASSTYTTCTYTATAYTPSQTTAPSDLVPPPAYSQAGANKPVGPFQACKAGQVGSLLEVDIVFAAGLYTINTADGSLKATSVAVLLEWQPIDATGAPTPPGVAWSNATFTFTAADNTPQRYTVQQAVPSGRYQVRATRTTNSDLKANTSDHVTWAGLKFQLDAPPAGTVTYGNVTLIACQIKASNGVAEDAASSLRFRVTRRLAPLGSGATAPTANPADAFVDIVTAPYGAARPLTAAELDLATLTTARSTWAGLNGFNAVFDQMSTVWEALQMSVQAVHAAPLPVGSRMSLIFDAAQPVRSQLFTDANMVAGSLTVTEAFDTVGTPAGVRVTYRDAVTFSQMSVVQPVDAPDYMSVDLFGCTDATVAAKHATLLQNKRARQRTTIAFDTELEGLACLPGDRVGVAAGMVKWAQSARVQSVAGLALTLDHALDWTAVGTYAVQLRDAQGTPHQVVGVTRGASDAVLMLPGAPPIAIYDASASQEATTLAFGVQNAEVTDWTVAKVTPKGATVTLEAVNYDAAIWTGTTEFQARGVGVPSELEEA